MPRTTYDCRAYHWMSGLSRIRSYWSKAPYAGIGLALSMHFLAGSSLPLLANSLAPTTKWLVGTWGLSDDIYGCENDNVVVYSNDGTWLTYGAAGRWRLIGNRLETVTLRVGTSEERMTTLRKPLRNSETVHATGTDTLVSRWNDGTTRHLKRCKV